MKKAISIIAVVIALITVLALPISAGTPYYTYTYSINGQALRSPDAYVPDREVNSEYMGLTDINTIRAIYPELSEEELKAKAVPIKAPKDLETDSNGNVYIVDRDNNRVVVLDSYYKLKFIIDSFRNKIGNVDTLNRPEGVFITDEKNVNGNIEPGRIFVCDTENQRILTFDLNGAFLNEIGKPRAKFIDPDDAYNPIAVAVDRYDRLYVIDRQTTHQGITVMTDTGEHLNYIPVQTVIKSTWEKLWDKIKTEEQKKKDTTEQPPPPNNITLAGDFIYVTISPNDESAISNAIRNKDKGGTNAPVKMLNAAGSELMRRTGFYPPSGEVDFTGSITATNNNADAPPSGPSKVVDVAIGPENTWSIIDNKRSKVFTYDFDGNLLFAFGDTGELLGNIPKDALNAITYQGSSMLLLNSNKGSFTVYNRTEYGDVLVAALENQNARRYDAAIADWTEVLKRNSNFDAAYIGIGNALYRSHDYEGAVEQYKYAYDTENYSNAYSELRQQWVSNYLWTIPLIIAVVCFLLIWFVKVTTKINKKVAVSGEKRTYLQELLFGFHLILHPFDGFWDLKHEKRGSVRAGTTYLLIAIVTIYYQSVGSGYVINPQGNYISVWGAILGVCIPLALWIIANWCITTLFDGEGSLKDIYIASTYALLPMILTMIPATIASNFVLASETKIITLITTLGFVWLGMLLFFGIMITHDYTIGKNIITTLATLVGMICIMFIVLLFSMLLGKLVGFASSIVTEIRYRL